MAPSHLLRRAINDHVRERLAREGVIGGTAHRGERLVSRGYTRAEEIELRAGDRIRWTKNDAALRHLDHAWASTVHAFQGRTVDHVIAAMEAEHPHLTTQKSFYVEISRARDSAELVTDDAGKLREHLEQATGERISALEGIGAAKPAPAKAMEPTPRVSAEIHEPGTRRGGATVPDKAREAENTGERAISSPERQAEPDLGM